MNGKNKLPDETSGATYTCYEALLQSVSIGKAMIEVAESGKFESSNAGGTRRKRGSCAYAPIETPKPHEIVHHIADIVTNCRKSRKSQTLAEEKDDELERALLTDTHLNKLRRFTDGVALKGFRHLLNLVPRQVNVVTLVEAFPVKGSGTTLPLDLRHIASRCRGCYYAPRRFSAVQLAFNNPRCRVLVFHTGRVVGTGTQGVVAARVALQLARRQLAEVPETPCATHRTARMTCFRRRVCCRKQVCT